MSEIVMEKQKHPQQGFNTAMGVLRFAKVYSPRRLECACERALYFKSVSYRAIKAILEQGLDKEPLHKPIKQQTNLFNHENIRGPEYYQDLRKENKNAHRASSHSDEGNASLNNGRIIQAALGTK